MLMLDGKDGSATKALKKHGVPGLSVNMENYMGSEPKVEKIEQHGGSETYRIKVKQVWYILVIPCYGKMAG